MSQNIAACKHWEVSFYVQDHVIELPESRQIVNRKHLLEQFVCFQEVIFSFCLLDVRSGARHKSKVSEI